MRDPLSHFGSVLFAMSIRAVVLCLVLASLAEWTSGQLELFKDVVPTLGVDELSVGNKTMVYFAREKSFDEALRACSELGMRLVTIANEEENKALFQFLHNRVWGVNGRSRDNTFWYIWSAGKQEEGAESFKWKSTGQNVTYSSWGAGEPNGGKSESCIELRYITGTTLFWNDSFCFIRKKYICELERRT